MDNRRNRFLKIEENIEKCLQFILCALIIITTAVFVLYSAKRKTVPFVHMK